MLELLTDRLRVRPYRPSDVDGLAAILTDPKTLIHWEAPFSRQDVIRWIGNAIERSERIGLANWAVEERATGAFVGNCGIQRKTLDGARVVEAGWHFNRSVWGRGYAAEAARAVLDHGLLDKKVERIVALILPQNIQSRRVAEKVGMTVAGNTIHSGMPHDVWEVRWTPSTS